MAFGPTLLLLPIGNKKKTIAQISSDYFQNCEFHPLGSGLKGNRNPQPRQKCDKYLKKFVLYQMIW